MATATKSKPATQAAADFMEDVEGQFGSSKVDREKGVIRRVKLLGVKSRNKGKQWHPDGQGINYAGALATAKPLLENAPVNINHPPRGKERSSRSILDRVGRVVKGSVTVEKDGLYGDLQLLPNHSATPQLLDIAESMPEVGGVSVNGAARGKLNPSTKEIDMVEMTTVRSLDFVCDPGTTRGFFEEADPELEPQGDALRSTFRDEALKIWDDPKLDAKGKADALVELSRTMATAAAVRDGKPAVAVVEAPESVAVASESLQDDERAELARLRRESKARDLLASRNLQQTPARVAALAAMPEGQQADLLEEFAGSARGGSNVHRTAPRSTGQAIGGGSRNDKARSYQPGEAARLLRG